MFPISDSVKAKGFPFITIFLIAVNILIFAQMVLMGRAEEFVNQYSLIPETVHFLDPSSLIQFVTSMFLHGGFFHIFSNMWFLWVFGDNVEIEVGHFKYLFLYLLAGFAGSLAQYLLNPTSGIPVIGASGAVSGVLGAYLTLFPKHSIKSVVFIFFVITVVNIPAAFYLFYWFILQFFQGLASLPSLNEELGGIAFFAHVGGFIAGIVLARFFVKNKYKPDYIEGEIVE